MASLSKYIGMDWDAASIDATVDGTPIQLFAGSGNLFTVAWTTANITVSVDARGNGIRLINHNGTANVTLNMSRMDPLFAKILNGQETYNDAMHSILITDSLETYSTSTASLSKIPNISGSTSAPNAPVEFTCIDVHASAHNTAHYEDTAVTHQ